MFRYALRQWRTSRAFTATAMLTLALGIGGTVAIVTLIDAVMIRPLPVSDPSRLYRIGDGGYEGVPGRWGFFPYSLFERFKASTPEFEAITVFDWGGSLTSVRRLGGEAAARPLRSQYVSGTYFSTLGVGALVGRVFADADDRASAPPVIVISHYAWQRAYGGDPSLVGSAVAVEGHPFTVIGVAPPGFFGDTLRADPPDLWIPLQHEPVVAGAGSLLHQSISPWLFVIGRLRPGASVDGLAPRLTEVLRRWIRTDGALMPDSLRDAPKQSVAVVPAGAGVGVLRERYNSTLQMLLAICALVLLVGCANLAHLLLARASARRTQTAVRRAIGATRMHVATEALTESVVLAAGGAVGGLLVAMAGARLLVALAFRTAHVVPIVTTPSVRVLVVTIALAFATAIVFGAAPAWFATRTDPMDALRGPGRATSDASRARGALVIVQAMLSVVLVAGAVMLARSLDNLRHQDFGYRVQGRVVVGLNRLPLTYSLQRLSALYDDIERRLAELPGIRGAGLALDNPLMSTWVMDVAIAGRPREASSDSRTSWDRVSAGYLQHLGVGLVRGRAFTPADNETTAPVAVVNEAFVRRFFRAGEDPLDRRFGIELPEHPGTVGIVGIVRDAKFARADLMQPARAMFFLPLAQRIDYKDDSVKMIERFSHFAQGMVLVTDARPADLEPLLRRTLAEIDPNLTITTVRTMQEQIDVTFDRERAVASLAELFGMVALVLAAVGVYGVTAYMVAQQTNELRIRMALGADRTSVIGLVLRRTLRRVAVGLVVGLPLAVLAARLMAARLYGVSTSDPFALASAAGALALSACAAAIIPATRAAALSPTIVLRSE